jgi:hypothetical protein
MIIFPYPKSTKCYGDTVIRRDLFTFPVDEKKFPSWGREFYYLH